MNQHSEKKDPWAYREYNVSDYIDEMRDNNDTNNI